MTCSNKQHKKTEPSCCDTKQRFDWLLWGSLAIVSVFYLAHILTISILPSLSTFSFAIFDIFNSMAWGLVIGILMVAILSFVPREFVMAVLGDKPGLNGILRATAAGLLLDLCSHGILMVGAKLYERGASIGQVMAFLIASPWNSLSLTVILVALIGLGWTLLFILLSAVIAVITGLIFNTLVARGTLGENSNKAALPQDFHFWRQAKIGLSTIKLSQAGCVNFIRVGLKESRMVIRWLLAGIILASLIRTFVADDYFGTFFGPTILGLSITLLVATVLEVCSEGSTPIAADIFNRASAPGNGFAFLMTGVSTDYTEVMVLKETTRSWKIALFLPLITLPQIIISALILNLF